jgi:hypothetical protein
MVATPLNAKPIRLAALKVCVTVRVPLTHTPVRLPALS